MSNAEIGRTIKTNPFPDQKLGAVKEIADFQKQHYIENYIQAILDGALGDKKHGAVLVVATRLASLTCNYPLKRVLNCLIKVAAANGVSKLIIGCEGDLTKGMAIEHIEKNGLAIHGMFDLKVHGVHGGSNRFSIDYCCDPETKVRIEQLLARINEYRKCHHLNFDFEHIGTKTVKLGAAAEFTLQIVASMEFYADPNPNLKDFIAKCKLVNEWLPPI